jgi:hypothetical protein
MTVAGVSGCKVENKDTFLSGVSHADLVEESSGDLIRRYIPGPRVESPPWEDDWITAYYLKERKRCTWKGGIVTESPLTPEELTKAGETLKGLRGE